MDWYLFITTLTGQILSWPVAVVTSIIILRKSLHDLFGRISEAEGFGVKASFQELADVVERVELESDLSAQKKSAESPRVDAGSTKAGAAQVDSWSDAAAVRLRSGLEEARLNPKAAIRTARFRLKEKVTMWDNRIQGRAYYEFNVNLRSLENNHWLSSDLSSAIFTAVALGNKLAAVFRTAGEAEAISYLSLISRLERLLDEEIEPRWRRKQQQKAQAKK